MGNLLALDREKIRIPYCAYKQLNMTHTHAHVHTHTHGGRICVALFLPFNVDGNTMEVCLYSDTYAHILCIFTNNGILLIIIDNLAVKLNKYIT